MTTILETWQTLAANDLAYVGDHGWSAVGPPSPMHGVQVTEAGQLDLQYHALLICNDEVGPYQDVSCERREGGSSSTRAGVVACFSGTGHDDSTYYALDHRHSDGSTRLLRVVDGSNSNLAPAVNVPGAYPRQMRIVVRPGPDGSVVVEGYVGGDLVMSAVDPDPLPGTQAGMKGSLGGGGFTYWGTFQAAPAEDPEPDPDPPVGRVEFNFTDDLVDEQPGYLTLPWTSAVAEVREAAWATGGRALVIDPTGSQAFLAAVFDGAPASPNIEMVARIRETGTRTGSHWLTGLAARVSGDLAGRTAVAAATRVPSSGDDRLVAAQLMTGVHDASYAPLDADWPTRMIRARLVGTTLQVRVWEDDTDEPDTWDYDAALPSPPLSGAGAGIFRYHGGVTSEIDWIVFQELDEHGEPVHPDAVRLMPAGDSITAGSSSAPHQQGTWRLPLYDRLTADRTGATYVGPYTDHPGPNGYLRPGGWPHGSCAVSGWRADQLAAEIGQAVDDYTPAVLMVLVGVNDLNQGATPETVAARLESVLVNARAVDPDLHVLVAEIPPTDRTGGPQVAAYNALVRGLAESMDDPDGVRTIAVDCHTGYSIADHHYDGLHPNQAGERLIAGRFGDALAVELGIGTPPAVPLRAVGGTLRVVGGTLT